MKNVVVPTHAIITEGTALSSALTTREREDSLFEHVAWLYALFRERIFQDDTARIIATLWPGGRPNRQSRLLELGCGPGFYSCNLARLFSELSVVGVDRCENQLQRARARARELRNCTFAHINAHELSCGDQEFDVVLASRLFTVLRDQQRVVGEIYRVLKSGGRCFIAEPRYVFWASLPLRAMWLLACVIHFRNGYREPHRARVYNAAEFADLFEEQPWKSVEIWQDGRYQYAVCQK